MTYACNMNKNISLTPNSLKRVTLQAPRYDDNSDDDLKREMPSDWWLTNRKVVQMLAFKLHVRDKEFVSICTGRPAGMTRIQQRETTTARITSERDNERVHSAAALLAVQQSDPDLIKKRRIQNDVAMNLVART